MNAGEILSLFRWIANDHTGGHEDDALVTDARGYQLLDMAAREACHRADLIIDRSTGAICSATITTSDSRITLDSRILHVRQVIVSGQTTPLIKRSVSSLDSETTGWRDAEGVPNTWVADDETGSILITPSAAATVTLTVSRLPLETINSPADILEIPQEYHEKLVDWMLYLFFTRQANLEEEFKAHYSTLGEKHATVFASVFGSPVNAIADGYDQSLADQHTGYRST